MGPFRNQQTYLMDVVYFQTTGKSISNKWGWKKIRNFGFCKSN